MFEKHTDVEARLNTFRSVRKESKTELEVLEAFANIKIRERYLDYWTPSDWMNPFEIIENGYFCTTGISVLLYHTLANLNFIDPAQTEWKVISNHVTGKDGAIFVCNNFAYNLVPGEKVQFTQNEDYIILQDFKKLNIPII